MIGSGVSLYGTPIPPLVLRHAQDAAWYWLQLETDRLSPVIYARRAIHYQRMFTCHLEGLRLAGETGWTLACKELDRWKDPEQLFVCWWLALQDASPERVAVLWPFMSEVRHAENAVAAALLWSMPQHRTPRYTSSVVSKLQWSQWLQTWLRSDVPQARRIALAACALCGELPDIPLPPLFNEDAFTVAAICRLAGRLRLEDCLPHVLHAAQSPHPEVREQAGVALLGYRRPEDALPLLLEALLRHHANMTTGEGHSALFEEHRAQVLACLCGHALPFGGLARISALPDYLRPLAYAHHGDAAALPLLAELLESVNAPTAFRSVCRLTGLDPDTEKLSLPPVLPDSPDYNEDPPDHPGHRLESGLPVPDAPKVQAWIAAHAHTFPTGVPLLQGREATLQTCLDVLETGMQDERFAAACHAMRCAPCRFVDTTAPVHLQAAQLQTLRQCCGQEQA